MFRSYPSDPALLRVFLMYPLLMGSSGDTGHVFLMVMAESQEGTPQTFNASEGFGSELAHGKFSLHFLGQNKSHDKPNTNGVVKCNSLIMGHAKDRGKEEL